MYAWYFWTVVNFSAEFQLIRTLLGLHLHKWVLLDDRNDLVQTIDDVIIKPYIYAWIYNF